MSKNIQVLIVDDHSIVRKGIRTLIASEPGMEVVGEAADGVEAVRQARSRQPDVILMDLLMPRKDGIDAIREIRQENPAARILVLTSFGEDSKVIPAVKAGALGYLLKDTSPQELLQAIRDIYQGRPSLHPAITLTLMRQFGQQGAPSSSAEPLTEREIEVVRLVARGLTNQEIAEKLVIAERTVSTHVSNILGKLKLDNRTQAALYALREGLVGLYSGDESVRNST